MRAVFEAAFGDATGHLFLIAVPFAVIALIAVLFIREVPLRTTIEREDEATSGRLTPARACADPACLAENLRQTRRVGPFSGAEGAGSAECGTRRRCPGRSGRRPGRGRC